MSELITRFHFPAPDKVWSTNDDRNLHHYTRAERIKTWKGAARIHYANARGKAGTAIPPALVRVHIPFKTDRRRDPHNYCGTVVKAIIDGLVLAGAWPDDTPEYVGHREPLLYKGAIVVVELTTMPTDFPQPQEG